MHITVVPASPKTGQATIRSLLADPSNPTVRAYYRDLTKVPAEFKSNPRFEAVKGDVEDAGSLDFSGSDAVFNITPPLYDDRDIIAHARLVSENVKAAVKKAGSVKRFVLLSSAGAQYDHGTVRRSDFPLIQLSLCEHQADCRLRKKRARSCQTTKPR
jgi:uncharacterized protein YbjT (DUF2867 family)